MKTECSLPQSQQTATYPYAEPDQCRPCLSFHILKIHFKIPPIYAWDFPAVSYPQTSSCFTHHSVHVIK